MKTYHLRIQGPEYIYGAMNFLAEGPEEARDFCRMLFPSLRVCEDQAKSDVLIFEGPYRLEPKHETAAEYALRMEDERRWC